MAYHMFCKSLIENAMGKAKHWLKLFGETVPVSAYDTFAALERCKQIYEQELRQWNSVIGALRMTT
jgi:hypothetical protein